MNNPQGWHPTATVVDRTQRMLNVVINHQVVYRAFNRAEAARWVYHNVPAAAELPLAVLVSRIQCGFRNGGRLATLPGCTVFKTNKPANWRGREYHVPRRKRPPLLSEVQLVTTWRR